MTLEEYLSKPGEPLAARIGSLCNASLTNEKFVELGQQLLDKATPEEMGAARPQVSKLEALMRGRRARINA